MFNALNAGFGVANAFQALPAAAIVETSIADNQFR
jgi:hypothetical protein